MQRAAIAGDRLSTGSWGSVLARFDLAVPVIIALVAFVAARRSLSEPGLFGRCSRHRVGVDSGHVCRLGADDALRQGRAARAGLTAPLPDHAALLPHAGNAPPRTRCRSPAADPRADRGADARPGRRDPPHLDAAVDDPRRAGGRCPRLPRDLHGRAGTPTCSGRSSWLPNHLDLVGVGLAVALVDASIDRQRRRAAGFGSAALRRSRRVSLLPAFALGLPKSPLIARRSTSTCTPSSPSSCRRACCSDGRLIPPTFTRRTRRRDCRGSWP